jgi:hypothetical protein
MAGDDRNPAEDAREKARKAIEKIRRKGRADKPGPVRRAWEKKHGKDTER